mmetsp:Transcript_47928/g.133639  ORF Transcript_47928/g.133639 Transcript_47928/m.133639 type:complete len:233 (+) Transcript_47928:339-1037(+)
MSAGSSFLVTSVWMVSLSSSRACACAVTCMIAVRNDCGLNSPVIHVTSGMSLGAPVHSCSCATRWLRLCSHRLRPRRLGKATLNQACGTWSKKRADCTASIESDMVSSPRKPRSSSCSVRVIVSSSTFSRSHSCKKTFWYGPMSSIVLTMPSMSNFWSRNISRMSCSAASAAFWDEVPPSPVMTSCGLRSRMVLNRFSLCSVRKPISAFGWRPNASGESPTSFCSMWSRTFS